MALHEYGTLFRRHPVLLRMALVALLAELGYAVIVPTLPLYLSESLRAPVALIGWVVGAFAVVETLCKAPLGALGDRIGRKPLIVGGLTLSALTPLLMTHIRVPLFFIPLRALDGAGSAALWPAVLATVADEVDEADRATGMALFNVTYMVGLGLGPWLGLRISHAAKAHSAALVAASALMATAALGAAALLPADSRRQVSPGHAGDEGHPLSLRAAFQVMSEIARARPALRLMFLLGFVQQFAVTLLTPILVLFARHQAGLSDLQISHLFLVPALVTGALALPLGRLADRLPRVLPIQIGVAVAAVGLAIVPQVRSVTAIGAVATALGLAFAFAEPAWMSLVSSLAPPGRQGAALGGMSAAQGVGFMFGPIVGGHLNEGIGPAAPFLLCSVLLAACLLLVTVSRARLEQ